MGSSNIQGKLWGAAAEDYTKYNEPTNKSLWEAMLSVADVGLDMRFLDLGCGGGGACLLAEGLGATIFGLDASEALIEIASRRIPNGDFRVGDIEELPFEDNSFDVSFSSGTLMFADDPSQALSEMKRVTNPNGRVVVGIWGSQERCDLGKFNKTLREKLPDSILPKLPPKSPLFHLSGPGILEDLIKQAGLNIIRNEELDHRLDYTDNEECWRSLKASGPMQGLMKLLDENRLKEIVLKAIEPHIHSEGIIAFKNRYKYVLATQ